MTVAELIAKLQELPQELEVRVFGSEYLRFEDIERVRQMISGQQSIIGINYPWDDVDDD